jgi:hypothetical protein
MSMLVEKVVSDRDRELAVRNLESLDLLANRELVLGALDGPKPARMRLWPSF